MRGEEGGGREARATSLESQQSGRACRPAVGSDTDKSHLIKPDFVAASTNQRGEVWSALCKNVDNQLPPKGGGKRIPRGDYAWGKEC